MIRDKDLYLHKYFFSSSIIDRFESIKSKIFPKCSVKLIPIDHENRNAWQIRKYLFEKIDVISFGQFLYFCEQLNVNFFCSFIHSPQHGTQKSPLKMLSTNQKRKEIFLFIIFSVALLLCVKKTQDKQHMRKRLSFIIHCNKLTFSLCPAVLC